MSACSALAADIVSQTKTILAAFLSISIALLCGCSRQGSSASAAAPGQQQRAAAPVIVSTVEQRDIPVEITAIGNVAPYKSVQIRSMVNGQINSVRFREGDDVKEGQLLFTLDKSSFDADLQKAVGQMKKDQAQAANSAAQAARYTQLEKEGVVASQVADQQRAQAESDAAAVAADQAAVRAAQVQLRYTEIRAPITARAGSVMINLGNLVKANDTPYLVQLNQIVPIYVQFNVPETQLDSVRKFAAKNLSVLAYPKGRPGEPSRGQLSFIDNQVDPQTGTVLLKATFENKDRRLWPGEFADVVLNLSTIPHAIVSSTAAIQSGQQGQYVYVVDEQGVAQARVVQTAGTFQNMTIITKGLAPGDKVVVQGQTRVAPNSKVMVQQTVPTNWAPAAGVGGGSAASPGGTQ
jgi:multidrug efflux system membrane fusion protein